MRWPISAVMATAVYCSSAYGSGVDVSVSNDSASRLMTQFGELSPSGTSWTVRISATDRKLHIIRHYAGEHWKSEADTLKEGWVAKEGWFAFVENGERVWAYDGDKDFFL